MACYTAFLDNFAGKVLMWHDDARSAAPAGRRRFAIIALLAICGCAGKTVMPAVSPATADGKVDMVDIATLVPDIALEIRYAGSDNFVGARSMVTSRQSACCCVRWRRHCSGSRHRCASSICE